LDSPVLSHRSPGDLRDVHTTICGIAQGYPNLPVVLVGVSMGAIMATRFVAVTGSRLPASFLGVVSVSGALSNDFMSWKGDFPPAILKPNCYRK
jgi:pimeloyl-ACP methyl ester carboxylesterase